MGIQLYTVSDNEIDVATIMNININIAELYNEKIIGKDLKLTITL